MSLSNKRINGYSNYNVMVWRVELGKDKLKIGELASAAGVTNRTVDYYTGLNLLEYEKNSSNYRLYPVSMIDRIHQIEQMKQQGMHLNDIRLKFNHLPIDIQDVRLHALELESDLKRLVNADDIEHVRNIAKKDLALIKALLIFIQ